MSKNILGERIRQRRAEINMSQAALAYEAGISSVALRRWEQGDVARPNVDNLRKVAAALGVPAEYLLDANIPAPSVCRISITIDVPGGQYCAGCRMRSRRNAHNTTRCMLFDVILVGEVGNGTLKCADCLAAAQK